MKRWLSFPTVQLALCVAAYALVGRYLGKMAVVWTAPLFAAAVARPLIALASSIRHRVRAFFWLPVHGRHYVYKDVTIHVLEDDNHSRWINLADARKVAAGIASEGALAIIYADQVRVMGSPAQAHIRDDALVAYLGRATEQTPLRFRSWVERNISFPGRRIRKSFGIGNLD